MEDKELVARILKGESSLFSLLVEKYQTKIIQTCYGFVHDQMIAEDIAQEVFLKVYQSLQGFRGKSSIGTWLYRIAVNYSLNYLRDHKREKTIRSIPPTTIFAVDQVFQIASDPSERADKRMELEDRLERVHQALDKLPEKQRTAIVLQKYEEMSTAEIASVMECSQAAVESLLSRAKKNLQKHLYECFNQHMTEGKQKN